MLRRLCFCLDKKGRETPPDLDVVIKGTAAGLAPEGIAVDVCAPDEAAPAQTPETLYLAEDMATAGHLKDRGGKVVGFLHGGNRQETFAGLKFVFDEADQVEADSWRKAWERLSGLPWTILSTQRLTVRETTLDDLNDFYRIYSDPEITAYQEGLFSDPEDERRYLADYIEKIYGIFGFGVWTLVRRSDGAVIGRAGFSPRAGFDNIELGFTVAKPYQGKGYAFEACEAILDFGREVLSIERVQAMVKVGNTASMRLCEKLGFERAGAERIEEDIYGERYFGEGAVSLAPTRYGDYIRYAKELKQWQNI